MRGFAILDLRFAIQEMGGTLLRLLAIAFSFIPSGAQVEKIANRKSEI
jgi:hypothetical protein